MNKRFALISSTGCSVVNTVFGRTDRREFDIHLVVTDRKCGATEFALRNKIPLVNIEQKQGSDLGDAIAQTLREHLIDYAYLFYTRMLQGRILKDYAKRIVNFHPSLLPAHPGLHSFEKSIESGAILVGSTVHFVDGGMDTGEQIMQTVTPALGVDQKTLRHTIFAQQCASLYYLHQQLMNSTCFNGLSTDGHSIGNGFFPNVDAKSLKLFDGIISDGTKE